MKPDLPNLIRAARGLVPADTVFCNGKIFNSFTCSFQEDTLAVKDGIVLGIGDYEGIATHDLKGACIVPGLIDAHVHIESSLLVPREYARLVALHGTTTVIADPHEIANVAGIKGIEFMLAERDAAAIDILYALPSCVPATPMDIGGASLDSQDLAAYTGRSGIIGLGEMMNYPGVIASDPQVLAKLPLFSIRDGHAPLLSGKHLNAYILAGFQTDHECTCRDEGKEKLEKGMYIFIREGSIEENILELIGIVTPENMNRCCFATDDCHADLLMHDGHIDRCIRKAIACGMQPEYAIRMATLSPAERFGLADRGALVPGRRADFCIVDDPGEFVFRKTFILGKEFRDSGPAPLQHGPPGAIRCHVPDIRHLHIAGDGPARVIGLVPGQIVTQSLTIEVIGRDLPDTDRDILKVLVCNRYGKGTVGLGLVHGFGFRSGAIAASIAHDAHNIVAVGASNQEMLASITDLIMMGGGMVARNGNSTAALPLACAGLMSENPYPVVIRELAGLGKVTDSMGGIQDPFMYLSFLALTVIPSMRVTDRGVFDADAFRDVPLFTGPS